MEHALQHEQIAERARQLWMERGRPGGCDLEHWLDAERQLREEFEHRPASTKTPPPDKPRRLDPDEAEKRLDGLIEENPSSARRTPKGEQL